VAATFGSGLQAACVVDIGKFKGTVSRDGYFFVEGLSILISTFCVCADGFYGLSKAFHQCCGVDPDPRIHASD
jgi:hypothetical protein